MRGHTAVRAASAPLAAIDALVPVTGHVLDVGCGHGLLTLRLARRPGRTVDGVDVDAAKVAAAGRALQRAGASDRARVVRVDAGWRPEPASCDAAVVVDVLYLLGRAEALDLVASLAEAVRPGGTVVVKEMALVPAWKRRLAVAQEVAAVRVLGLTAGSSVDLVPLEDVAAVLADHGHVVSRRRLDHRSLHPHAAVVGLRPEAA